MSRPCAYCSACEDLAVAEQKLFYQKIWSVAASPRRRTSLLGKQRRGREDEGRGTRAALAPHCCGPTEWRDTSPLARGHERAEIKAASSAAQHLALCSQTIVSSCCLVGRQRASVIVSRMQEWSSSGLCASWMMTSTHGAQLLPTRV